MQDAFVSDVPMAGAAASTQRPQRPIDRSIRSIDVTGQTIGRPTSEMIDELDHVLTELGNRQEEFLACLRAFEARVPDVSSAAAIVEPSAIEGSVVTEGRPAAHSLALPPVATPASTRDYDYFATLDDQLDALDNQVAALDPAQGDASRGP